MTNLISRNTWKSTTGMNTPAVTTGPGYWSATVSHTQLAGATCGIGVNTTNPTVSTAGDGEPSCYVP